MVAPQVGDHIPFTVEVAPVQGRLHCANVPDIRIRGRGSLFDQRVPCAAFQYRVASCVRLTKKFMKRGGTKTPEDRG